MDFPAEGGSLARVAPHNEDGGSFRYYPRDPNRPFAPEDFGPAFNDERRHLTISKTIQGWALGRLIFCFGIASTVPSCLNEIK